MQSLNKQQIIEKAIQVVAENSPLDTDGKWLEYLTADVAPYLKEWDIENCYSWNNWPEREEKLPGSPANDMGIDAVAVRRSDGEHIAIQCKSRQLDEHGSGKSISSEETAKFSQAAAHSLWAERWIVTNGDNPLNSNVEKVLSSMTENPVKIINIANDLQQHLQAATTDDDCLHCQPNPNNESRTQTKSCMQNEAVAESVRILKEHEQSESGGLPVGQARGKIILPCGTGKTRISLRIVEELTPTGGLSIVLCPSIALVAQIRREYLINTSVGIRALAVCSDETAGYDPKKEEKKDATKDPTIDNSNVSELEVKGKVTTDAGEIAQWIEEGDGNNKINVIFGTYQSSSKVSEALMSTQTTASVLVADEAPSNSRPSTAKKCPKQETPGIRRTNPRLYPVPSQRCVPIIIPNLSDSHTPHLRCA